MATYDELTIGGAPRGFAINGRPLGALFELGGRLCIYDLDAVMLQAYVRQLLRRAPAAFASGRCPLYVCERCADLGCGAIAVRVTEVEDCFVWSDFAVDSHSGAYPLTWADERAFYFARADYLAAIY